MKFEKIKIDQNKSEVITCSDIKMFRMTLQFPMHKSADISCIAEEAASCISWTDNEDFEKQPVLVEQSDVTNADLLEFHKNHPKWIIYNFDNDQETTLDEILITKNKNSANKKKTKR